MIGIDTNYVAAMEQAAKHLPADAVRPGDDPVHRRQARRQGRPRQPGPGRARTGCSGAGRRSPCCRSGWASPPRTGLRSRPGSNRMRIIQGHARLRQRRDVRLAAGRLPDAPTRPATPSRSRSRTPPARSPSRRSRPRRRARRRPCRAASGRSGSARRRPDRPGLGARRPRRLRPSSTTWRAAPRAAATSIESTEGVSTQDDRHGRWADERHPTTAARSPRSVPTGRGPWTAASAAHASAAAGPRQAGGRSARSRGPGRRSPAAGDRPSCPGSTTSARRTAARPGSADADTSTSDGTTAQVAGLTNGTEYVCRAFAESAAGRSDARRCRTPSRRAARPSSARRSSRRSPACWASLLLGGSRPARRAPSSGRASAATCVAVVDVVHTANLGHGSKLGIRFVKAPDDAAPDRARRRPGPEADIKIRHLGRDRFEVQDRLGKRNATSGEADHRRRFGRRPARARAAGVRHQRGVAGDQPGLGVLARA